MMKLLYVSEDRFGLIEGNWYSVEELSQASKIKKEIIIERVRHASNISAGCNLVRSQQLKKRQAGGVNKMATFALETHIDYFSQGWLRKAL